MDNLRAQVYPIHLDEAARLYLGRMNDNDPTGRWTPNLSQFNIDDQVGPIRNGDVLVFQNIPQTPDPRTFGVPMATSIVMFYHEPSHSFLRARPWTLGNLVGKDRAVPSEFRVPEDFPPLYWEETPCRYIERPQGDLYRLLGGDRLTNDNIHRLNGDMLEGEDQRDMLILPFLSKGETYYISLMRDWLSRDDPIYPFSLLNKLREAQLFGFVKEEEAGRFYDYDIDPNRVLKLEDLGSADIENIPPMSSYSYHGVIAR